MHSPYNVHYPNLFEFNIRSHASAYVHISFHIHFEASGQVWHGSEDGAPSDSSARSRDVGHDWKEIDEQLRDLGSRFNVRIQVEAALRQRCQEMMEKLTGDVQALLA